MHKIKKGIKKKIKGKKDKGKEDLFDPEQLAKFKKELEEGRKSPVPGETDDPDHTHAPTESHADHEQDEEWLKFKQLTSGVDDILKKTTGDLDRIKSSSYFQRTSKANEQFASERPSSSAQSTFTEAPQSSSSTKDSRWTGFEGKHQEDNVSEEEPEERKDEVEVGNEEQSESTFKEFEIPEEDPDLDDSLFDTTFVDAIASGEIKLAYIPESPTGEPDEEDPFDTSAVADVVKKIEEDEKKRKKQVNLGLAVDFLTNKTDKVEQAPVGFDGKKKPRPRPHNINLIGSFDDDSLPIVIPSDTTIVERAKDIFDEILDSPPKDTSTSLLDAAGNICVTASPLQQYQNKESAKDDQSHLKDLISEFDIINDVTVDEGLLSLKLGPEEDEEDEFALLAAESLHKEVTVVNPVKVAPPKPPPPTGVQKPAAPLETEAEEVPEKADEEDPFDTTFVEKIQPGKGELKIIENEFLDTKGTAEDDDDDFDFNPRLGEFTNIPVTQVSPVPSVQTDLLDTTEGELSKGAVIQPISELVPIESDHDPFDTSRVETVPPGRAELKLLEEELSNFEEPTPGIVLSAVASAIINTPAVTDPFDDDFADFDPRAGEVKPEPLHPLDLLHEESVSAKVLIPITDDPEEEIDPFDTSIVTDNILPGKIELRLLESELISAAPIIPFSPSPAAIVSDPNFEQVIDIPPSTLHREFSDPDFDPRGGEPAPVLIETDNTPRDVFESHENLTCEKPLTPSIGEKEYVSQDVTDFVDPFDTSAVEIDNINKVDLKLLEGELLNSTEDFIPAILLPQLVIAEPKQQISPASISPVPVPHLLETDHLSDECADLAKPLTPSEIDELGRPSVFEDPFDTSILPTKAVPGKTELKILEEELDVEPGLKRSVTDPDFNPRESIHPSVDLSCQPLVPQVQGESNISSETYEDDPFDTSHAETLIPGKAELKILEAELL